MACEYIVVGSTQSQVKSQASCAQDGYNTASSLKVIMKDMGIPSPPRGSFKEGLDTQTIRSAVNSRLKALGPKGIVSGTKALEDRGTFVSMRGEGAKDLAISTKLRIRFFNCQQTFHSKPKYQCGYFKIVCLRHT